MSVIVILILASLSLALAFLAGFIWAVRSGQYEDTFTPSMRVLAEEEGQTRGARGERRGNAVPPLAPRPSAPGCRMAYEPGLNKLDFLGAGKNRDKRAEKD
jgi:cbb3-type cytochrome oxidase maturation protein